MPVELALVIRSNKKTRSQKTSNVIMINLRFIEPQVMSFFSIRVRSPTPGDNTLAFSDIRFNNQPERDLT